MSIWSELRRRNVVRVAAAYLAASWLLLQIADVMLASFFAPAWILQALIVAMILGFLPAALLAWHYEWTADGIRTASDVPATEVVRFAGRKLDFAIIGLLILAVAFLWIERDDEFVVAPNSIAVLPFANLSPDPDKAFYAAGLHDEILNQLAKLSSLSLVSRTTAIQYADTTLTIPEIARELHVANVIEGSVRYAGDRIRITMQLIDAVTDEHLWSETYDREFVDIFEIESDIAISVAEALAAEFSEQERMALDERPFESTEAYKAHLRVLGSDLAARENASLAIAVEPDDFRAYITRAYAGAMSFANSDRPAAKLSEQQMDQMAASVIADVDHVLTQAADPRLHSMAYNARALLHTQFWRWTEASADLDRSIEVVGAEPLGNAYYNLAWQLAAIGRFGEGIGFGERALQNWPEVRPGYAHAMLGFTYMSGDRPAAAAAVFRKGIEAEPGLAILYVGLWHVELILGEPITNPGALEATLANTEIPTFVAQYAYAIALHGDMRMARVAIERFEVLEERGFASAIDQTFIALARGNYEQAKDLMRRVIENIEAQQPDPGGLNLPQISQNLIRDPVLDEPEFVALREQLRGR